MPRCRWASIAGVALAVLAAPARSALAQEGGALEIFADGGRSWDDVVREVQRAPATAGTTVDVGVRSGALTFGCSDYELTFDDVGRAAFAVEGCDAATGMTRVRVASRAALFDASTFVPTPRRAAVYAVILRRARVEGGGAPPEGGSRVACSVRLEPYLWDGLHGRAVPLPWDRFEVRPLREDVHAAPDGAGWVARGESQMSVRFRYEVIDRRTGAKVIENEATLACHDGPVEAGEARAEPVPLHDEPEPLPMHAEPVPLPEWLRVETPAPAEAPPAPAEAPTPAAASPDRSFASLKLHLVELALLRNDAAAFRGAFQLAPYNGARDFAGGLQLGITNSAGEHPWGFPSVPGSRRRGAAADEPEPATRPDAFRGLAQVGVVNAVDGDFTGVFQIGAVTGVDGSFRGVAQVGVIGAGVGGHSVLALQLAGFFAYAKEVTGVQISGGMATADTVHGLQISRGGDFVYRGVDGLQIGFMHIVIPVVSRSEPKPPDAYVHGAQIGVFNLTQALTGAQLGAFNIARDAHGLQLGVVNYARHLDGIQLGGLNIAENGVVPFMPVVNAAFD